MQRWGRLSLALGLGLALLVSLWGLLGPVQAAPLATIRYVSSVSGEDTGDCTGTAAPCRTLQYAVDQAVAGDEVRIAALDNAALTVYTATGSGPVVSVNKSLVLGGGYVYVNVLGVGMWGRGLIPAISQVDGEGQRQGVSVSGATTATLEWLLLINGHAPRGGNVYAENATVQFSAVGVLSGTADYGGGLYLKNCRTEFNPVDFELGDLVDLSGALLVRGNSAQQGGGVYVEGGDPALTALAVTSNTATGDGGGFYLAGGTPILAGAVVMENTAGQRGGGLFLEDSFARIAGTAVYSNVAAEGGGFYLDGPLASWPINVPIIANNYVRHNQGGGFYFNQVIAGVVNNVVTDNSAAEGAGATLYAASPYLIHNTFAANTGGSGLYLTHQPAQVWPPVVLLPSLPQLVNNIIVSHTVGVYVAGTGLPYPLQNRATLEGTLWWGNGANTSGSGQAVSTAEVSGDPRFICTGELPTCVQPYHLEDDSAAVDAGVELTLPLPDDDVFLADIDGQLRPSGAGYDIGADEVVTLTLDVWLLPALSTLPAEPGETVTHTHRLLNTGTQTDTYDLTLENASGWATLIGPAALTLRAQTSATVQVRVAVPQDATGGMTDTVRLAATSQADADRAVQAVDLTWVVTQTLPFYDVAVDKWADETSVEGGTAIHYTLLVTKSEDITRAVAVTLTDTFAPIWAVAAWQLPSPCQGVTTTGVVTCAWTLAPSSMQFALPLVVTTSAAYSGTLVNVATVRAPVLDAAPGNNVAQAAVYVGRRVNVYLPLVLRAYP